MATSTIISSEASNVVGSSIYVGGSISTSNFSGANSIPITGSDVSNTSGVKETTDVGKVNSTLTFLWNNPRPLVKGYTRVVNSASADTFAKAIGTSGSAAVELISSSHPRTSARTRLIATAIRDGFYNPYSGDFDAGYPDNEVTSFQSDNGVVSSRNDTSNLFFYNGGGSLSKAYDRKTG